MDKLTIYLKKVKVRGEPTHIEYNLIICHPNKLLSHEIYESRTEFEDRVLSLIDANPNLGVRNHIPWWSPIENQSEEGSVSYMIRRFENRKVLFRSFKPGELSDRIT